jgi:hypothetical protein
MPTSLHPGRLRHLLLVVTANIMMLLGVKFMMKGRSVSWSWGMTLRQRVLSQRLGTPLVVTPGSNGNGSGGSSSVSRRRQVQQQQPQKGLQMLLLRVVVVVVVVVVVGMSSSCCCNSRRQCWCTARVSLWVNLAGADGGHHG